MSSTDIRSTNDITSTVVSDTNESFATSSGGANSTANTLTTDGIIRECIKQGFYRNPICNEKLYLHNRGYDSIAPTAFEPYTDVKVLWLEGNGLSVLPCGGGYTQVRPPARVDPFASELEAAEAERAAVPAEPLAQHVDPNTEAMRHQAALSPDSVAEKESSLPLAADVPPADRDAFSSLYPTVRQLYLHNNLFRSMPDLSRFERLDTVNLSGNFFKTVEPHCAHYDSAVRQHHASEVADGTSPTSAMTSGASLLLSKSLQREQEQRRQQVSHDPYSAGGTAPSEDLTVVALPEDAKRQRAVQLERYRHTTDVFSVFCGHSPLPESEEAEEARDEDHQRRVSSLPLKQPPPPAPEHRNPCSSLRSLNLAGNRLQGFEDCLGLLCYRSLAVLDLSHNHIADGEALLLILERLPRLQSLKLSGNPLVRSLPRYRKRVLSRCKRLLHLDDRPVFAEERRVVTAWAIGGDDGEEKERHAIQEERAAAEKQRLEDFRRLISRHQRAGAAEAPHEDYINAITTVAALSTAADTADSRGRNRAGRSSRETGQRHGRPPTSELDSSSTSSESEDDADDDNQAGSGTGGRSAAAMRAIMMNVSNTDAQADASDAAAVGMIASQHENKPLREVRAASSSQLQQQQRVLSSNQRVEAAASTATGAGDDSENDDIFVPSAV
ncbi:Leucine rich repeat, putative [Leishmania donovani]|uniref:Leucine rich repeat, putative n=1 Tax=Leishmania donovani TaxID=5661 RepID=A0A3Q8IFU8_LEIDO|nr:Leucine rich repeat, putative [Leishmania donovani]